MSDNKRIWQSIVLTGEMLFPSSVFVFQTVICKHLIFAFFPSCLQCSLEMKIMKKSLHYILLIR